MKYVYLAGPITGVSYGDTMDWRATAQGLFVPGIQGVSPMRVKEFLASVTKIGHSYPEQAIMGAANAICARDNYDCTHADAVLAYMPRALADKAGYPSVGTCIELGWATASGVPVVLVSDDQRVIGHPLVSGGKVAWVLPELKDGCAAINALLGVYANGQ